MSIVYTAQITGAADALPDWPLTIRKLDIDLTVTKATVSLTSPIEQDHIEALLRPNGSMEVYESIDGESPVELVSVGMAAADQQGLRIEVREGSPQVTTILRADGTVAAWVTVSNRDVTDVFQFRQVRGSSKTWRILFQRDITPGSTVLSAPGVLLTVDRSAINLGDSPPAQQSLTMDGTP